MTNKTALLQLYLFDCDGGRSSIFNDIEMLTELPDNCELYLFWNSHDPTINSRLNRLKDNQKLHLHPTRCTNSKNAVDGLLIYYLGKLSSSFARTVIVHGGDAIYDEIIAETKVDSHKVNYPQPNELQKLIGDMKKFNQDNPHTTNDFKSVLESSVQVPLSTRCPKCNKKFKTILGTIHHIMGKHHLNNDDIVNFGVRKGAQYLDSPVTTTTNQSTKSNMSAIGLLKCTHPKCLSKMKTFKKEKDLEAHRKSKHPC